ncbi:hypothetical protein [Halobacteriovorax sp. HLS]|uniref:hypothetical protein n=1 Tax=Halobacteriovorax sp. HLS TaxID=2234000 RepID=UPI000FDAE542|nr:hypothetical protein [Halobacteriovorax sp. HLS]
MFFMFKFALYFAISFVILSFPIADKTVFEHVNKIAHPYTDNIYKSVKSNVSQGIKESSKLFSNSSPNTDEIKTKYSSMKKKVKKIEQAIESNHESFTIEEKEMLKKVLNTEGQL